MHSARHYASGKIFGLETVLQQKVCRCVSALAGAANHQNLAVVRQAAKA